MAIIRRRAGNILSFTQDIASNPYGVSASSTLTFSQVVKVSPIRESLKSKLSLKQAVTVRTSIKHLAVTQQLVLQQHAARVREVEASNAFFPIQLVKQVEYEAITQQLVLGQVAVGVASKVGRSTLVLTQTVALNVVRNLTPSNTLALQSFGTAYKLDPNFIALDIALPDPPDELGRCP